MRPVCLDYANSADNHDKMLRIDASERRPYRDWFVLLGTGGPEVTRSRRIFYDQILFKSRIDWDAQRVVIPLFSKVGDHNRRLVIDMSCWPDPYRHSLRAEITDVALRGAEAWRRGDATRPWLHFALDEKGDEIALTMREFLGRQQLSTK